MSCGVNGTLAGCPEYTGVFGYSDMNYTMLLIVFLFAASLFYYLTRTKKSEEGVF